MSPIRTSERGRYPANWDAIRTGIVVRAGFRCECRGECGTDHSGRCWNRHRRSMQSGAMCILTVSHLDHTPEHCDPSNLRAMCQGCHLRYDRDHHRETRMRTRAQEQADAGQGLLPW